MEEARDPASRTRRTDPENRPNVDLNAPPVRVHVSPQQRHRAALALMIDRPYEVLFAVAGVISGVRYISSPRALERTAVDAVLGATGAQIWNAAWLIASVVLLTGMALLRPALHAAGLAAAGGLLIVSAIARIDTFPVFDHKGLILLAAGLALWARLIVLLTAKGSHPAWRAER